MELHIIFLILGGLLIVLLAGFSIYSARREKSRIFSNTFTTRQPATPIKNIVTDVPATLDPLQYGQNPVPTENESESETGHSVQIQQEVENSLREIKINLPVQETAEYTQTPLNTPIYHNQPAQPTFLQTAPPIEPLTIPTVEPIQPETTSVLEQSLEELERQAAERELDLYSDASVRIELAKNSIQTPIEEVAQPESTVITQNNIITLYVVAPEGQQFDGHYVVQSLEALGFQFGEYQIYHRHQHLGNNDTPVIFSVANMMQPGIFDLNNLDSYATVGLVLFMHLPSEGSDLVNLKLMLKAAESLAEALGGFILNEQRELFNETDRQAYFARVS
ncbi:cell division protein ZipA [[Haemophilus] ducreyi]|uniref:Cell division protein ZipA n=2 Tax=Haemophilus ducreyi TaxID=730 RepID=ZIPA_HAEDU|nr:cell division protein ZipA [[Haemophilus] ducreyi]Q7VMX6.1 RecName: Full=Cell division protein ZipA [[Haemophilus] ducreyi 35000HP]AAP95726.1 cell division protein [[Haemophilus] ducreyi 35000HP]AKO30785.1 cell division protein ZipA [[Haemophilus] ducreyi]AKO32223.1 cell division protein ZipA [[Haemophilus] ducreyi]AKO33677.1 cell division protein ZipA [[Haemophilus] ducreyi]AKO35124.1 cell division protein ZipA [[Haemophilus] ducreyi]